MTGRNRQQHAQERQDEPGKNTLNNPVTLPTPRLDLIDGNIAAGLAKCSNCYD
jgi:hypothetical protein